MSKYNYSKYTNEQSKRLIKNFPDRIPIILENLNSIMKTTPGTKNYYKYLVHRESDFGHFMASVRKKIELSETESLYMFTTNNTIPFNNTTMGELYDKYRHSNGFLIFFLNKETTFGC